MRVRVRVRVRPDVDVQLRAPLFTVKGSTTYGYRPHNSYGYRILHLRCQAPPPAVAASLTYGCRCRSGTW